MRRWRCVAALLLAGAASLASARTDEQLVTVATRPGVTDSYLLVTTDRAPKKVVALAFVGGEGNVDLATRAATLPAKFGPNANFLVRARESLVDADVAEAIVDAPSDLRGTGMNDAFRMSPEHAADIRAVIGDLQQRYPGARIWLVGTSRGTISAAALGVALHDTVAGVILSSTLTQQGRGGPGLSRFDWATLTVPTLVIHHVDDGCRASPYYAAQKLGERYAFVSVKGGDPPQSDACDPRAPHGYFGLDAPVAAVMREFMLGQPYPHAIP